MLFNLNLDTILVVAAIVLMSTLLLDGMIKIYRHKLASASFMFGMFFMTVYLALGVYHYWGAYTYQFDDRYGNGLASENFAYLMPNWAFSLAINLAIVCFVATFLIELYRRSRPFLERKYVEINERQFEKRAFYKEAPRQYGGVQQQAMAVETPPNAQVTDSMHDHGSSDYGSSRQG